MGVCSEQKASKMPWPKIVQEFPEGEEAVFSSGPYEIKHSIPQDPDIQSAGGSGGPIVEITIRERKGKWIAHLLTQSVGERLLEAYNGRPQIEVWSRGGGGSWSRELYRYIKGEYRSTRIDDFEHVPSRGNQNAPTATLPNAFHGKAPPEGDPRLYYVETRTPTQ